MEGVGVLFDASPYMLFEASGDSEAQYSGGAAAADPDASAVEDDAQSCSCSSLSYIGVARVVDDHAGGVDSEYDCSGDEEEDGGSGSDEEEEDGVVDQWRGGVQAPPPPEADQELNKSQAFEDTNVKLMNDEETDRLFWEACLKS